MTRTDFFLRILVLVDGLAVGPMRHLGRLPRGIPVPLRLLYAREDPTVAPAVGPKRHALLPAATIAEIDAFEGLAARGASAAP